MVNDIDIKNKLDAFAEDMLNLYNEAFKDITKSAFESAKRSYIDRLYHNSVLSRFAQMGVTEESAKQFLRVFTMLEACENIHPTDTETIRDVGLRLGFNEEESMCLYNMRHFEIAINNLRSQQSLAYRYVTKDKV